MNFISESVGTIHQGGGRKKRSVRPCGRDGQDGSDAVGSEYGYGGRGGQGGAAGVCIDVTRPVGTVYRHWPRAQRALPQPLTKEEVVGEMVCHVVQLL